MLSKISYFFCLEAKIHPYTVQFLTILWGQLRWLLYEKNEAERRHINFLEDLLKNS